MKKQIKIKNENIIALFEQALDYNAMFEMNTSNKQYWKQKYGAILQSIYILNLNKEYVEYKIIKESN